MNHCAHMKWTYLTGSQSEYFAPVEGKSIKSWRWYTNITEYIFCTLYMSNIKSHKTLWNEILTEFFKTNKTCPQSFHFSANKFH